VYVNKSITLRGGYTATDYSGDRSQLTSVTDANNADYNETVGGLRLAYELSPQTSIFADGSVNRRKFDTRVDAAGFLRGSDGYEAALGVTWSNGSKLSGELSVGYQSQTPDDARLKRLDGIGVDATLEWQATALTRLSLSAATDINETTLANSSGYVSREVGIGIEHALRRNLILNGEWTYTQNDFSGVNLVEEETEASLGVDYYLSRYVALTADMSWMEFTSTQAGADYDATTVTVGVKVQR
jgi:hypothetical protein